MSERVYKYFLGCKSPMGFASFFEQLTDEGTRYTTYIIKAGPGCGKSTLMKNLAKKLNAAGYDIELIYCSSDPDSLDGVLCEALGFAIIDGTAPHVVEPRYPMARERIVTLYDCIDAGRLAKNAAAVIESSRQNEACHSRAGRFITAVGSLVGDIERTVNGSLNRDKLKKYTTNLSAKLMPKKGAAGAESARIDAALTPRGYVDFSAANARHYQTRYVFDDRYGAVSRAALAMLRDRALELGDNVVSARNCFSPLDWIDSLYLPELSLCFLSSGFLRSLNIPGARVVHERRFLFADTLQSSIRRITFCKKAIQSLLGEAIVLLGEAKTSHDDIEAHYVDAIDFASVEAIEQALYADLGL